MTSIFLAILITLLPPCQYEDSANCYWSDGSGASFVDIAGTAYYFD